MAKEEVSVVTEWCSFCQNEVEMRWDTALHGYTAFCPYCGKLLMLCGECMQFDVGGVRDCDFDSASGKCKRA